MAEAAAKALSPAEQQRQDFLKNDILSTGTLPKAPKRDPEAHRGLIVGISLHHNVEKGSYSAKIEAKSDSSGKSYEYYLPIPRTYAQNWSPNFDANTLSPGVLNPQTGKVEGNERETFAIRIGNSDGTGELQRLRYLASQEGKKLPDGLPPATNIEEFIMVHNLLLANTRCVFTLRADANPSEPQFANVLKLRGFFNERDVIGNSKMLKGFVRVWEQQQ